jgi:hypothetical protein
MRLRSARVVVQTMQCLNLYDIVTDISKKRAITMCLFSLIFISLFDSFAGDNTHRVRHMPHLVMIGETNGGESSRKKRIVQNVSTATAVCLPLIYMRNTSLEKCSKELPKGIVVAVLSLCSH